MAKKKSRKRKKRKGIRKRLRKKIRKKLKKKVEETAYFLFYRTLYIAGLTILIPMAFTFAFKEPGEWYSQPFLYLFASALLIIISFYGMFRRKKKIDKTLKSLAKMSLIPGAIALVLFVFGRGIIYNTLRLFVPAFEKFEQYLSIYLDKAIPNMGLLVAGYIVIGTALYIAGSKIKK